MCHYFGCLDSYSFTYFAFFLAVFIREVHEKYSNKKSAEIKDENKAQLDESKVKNFLICLFGLTKKSFCDKVLISQFFRKEVTMKRISRGFYKLIIWILYRVYPGYEIEGAENVPNEPVIFIGNHSQIHGPLAGGLYFPFYKN